MKSVFQKVAVLVAAAPFAGCSEDRALPTGPETVRLAVVAEAPANQGAVTFDRQMRTEITQTPQYVGDPDGRGEALITIDLGRRVVCWKLKVVRVLLPGTAAHIHLAPVGVRGPIAIGLSAPNASGNAVGCKEDQDPVVLQHILDEPAAFYVNVHTTDYPAGAVRGQFK